MASNLDRYLWRPADIGFKPPVEIPSSKPKRRKGRRTTVVFQRKVQK